MKIGTVIYTTLNGILAAVSAYGLMIGKKAKSEREDSGENNNDYLKQTVMLCITSFGLTGFLLGICFLLEYL